MEVFKHTFKCGNQNGKPFFFSPPSPLCCITASCHSEILHICLFVLKCYLLGAGECLQSEAPLRCNRICIELIFSHQKENVSACTGRGSRLDGESKTKSGNLLSDSGRVFLTPLTGNRRLLGGRTMLAFSTFSPPNILLIDFRGTAPGRLMKM